MFRAINLRIFMSTILWCNTQCSVPEDGQNNCPKHVELIGIINKPLFFQLYVCLCYLYEVAISIVSQIYCCTGYIISIQAQITEIMHLISPTVIVGKVFRRPCKPIRTYQHEKEKKPNAFDEMCLVCLCVTCVCSVSTLTA